MVLIDLQNFAPAEISLRNGNRHCLFVITVLLVGRKNNNFLNFFSSSPSSIKMYAYVSGNSHPIALSTVG